MNMSSLQNDLSQIEANLFAAPSEEVADKVGSNPVPRKLPRSFVSRILRCIRLQRSVFEPDYIHKKILRKQKFQKKLQNFKNPFVAHYRKEEVTIWRRRTFQAPVFHNQSRIHKEAPEESAKPAPQQQKKEEKIPIVDEFRCEFLSGTAPTLEAIYAALSKLKPINLMGRLADLAAATSFTEELASMSALAELFDLFWTPELMTIKNMVLAVAAYSVSGIIRWSWGSVFENQGFKIPEESKLNDMCQFFGFEMPKEFSDIGAKIFGGIMAGVVILTGGALTTWSEFTVRKVIKNVKDFSSTCKSLTNLMDCVPRLWTFIMTQVAYVFGIEYETEETAQVKAFKEDLLSFKIRVTELVDIMNNQPSDLLLEPQKLDECAATLMRLDILYDKLLSQKENMAATKIIFDDVRKSVESIQAFVNNLKSETCQKIEPFVVVLGGEAGIGKSQFIAWLTQKIVEKIKQDDPTKEGLKPSTYSRNSMDKFWSGYAGQLFVVYDDFGQNKADTDHADLMLFKNPNRTLLTMSESKEKGRLFSSMGVIAATNQESMTTSAVVKCTYALTRRFEINVLVSDPNYKDFVAQHGCSPGDFEKIHSDKDLKAMIKGADGVELPYFDDNFEHLDFFFVEPDIAKRSSNPPKRCTATEIVDRCFNFYKYYLKKYRKSVPSEKISAEVFNLCDSSSSSSIGQRKHASYEQAAKDYKKSQYRKSVEASQKKLDELRNISRPSTQVDLCREEVHQCNANVEIVKNHGLGDCLYQSLIALGVMSGSSTQDIKAQVMSSSYVNTVAPDLQQEIFEQMKFDMFRDVRGWGSSATLKIVCLMKKIRICIHYHNSPNMHLIGDTGEIFHIHFTGESKQGHWDAMRVLPGVKPPPPSPEAVEELFEDALPEGELKPELPTTTPEEFQNVTNDILEKAEKLHKDTNVPINACVEDIFNWQDALETFVDQAQAEVDSSANAFITHTQVVGQIFAVKGAPGTGKSTLMNKVMAHHKEIIDYCHGSDLSKFVITKPIAYFEDITISKEAFHKAREMVMACYDGQSVLQVIFVSYNEQVAKSFCENDEQFQAFKRRTTGFHYEFALKSKGLFPWMKTYYTAEDVLNKGIPYTDKVKIIDESASAAAGKPVLIDHAILLQRFLRIPTEVDPNLFSQVITLRVPYIGRNQYTPNYVIKIKGPMLEASRELYDSPYLIVAKLAKGDFKMIKGSYWEGKNIAAQFAGPVGAARPPFPNTMDEFILVINNSDYFSEKPFITELQYDDGAIVLMPKINDPKIIRCFRVCEFMTTGSQFCDNEGNTAAPTIASQVEYQQFSETAKKVSEQIVGQTEEAEQSFFMHAGLSTMFSMMPATRSLFDILHFGLKLVVAGMSIKHFFKMAKERFFISELKQQYPQFDAEKKKGKTKMRRNFLKHKYAHVDYDELKRVVDSYGTSAARMRGKYNLLDDFIDSGECTNYDHPEHDSYFRVFVMNYESENAQVDPPQKPEPKKKNLLESFLESGGEPIVKKEPVPVLGLPLTIEGLTNELEEIIKSPHKTQDSILCNEALLDPSLMSYVRMASNNTVEVGHLQMDGSFERSVYGMMIKGRVGVTVAHFLDDTLQPAVSFFDNGERKIFPMEVNFINKKFDITIFTLPTKARQFRDVSLMFPTGKYDHSSWNNKPGILVTTELTENGFDRIIRNIKLQSLQETRVHGSSELRTGFGYQGYMVGTAYSHAINTKPGDCGSIVIVNDPTVKYRFVGIHNAATQVNGFCSMILQEYFANAKFRSESKPVFKSVTPALHPINYRQETDEYLMDMPVVAELEEQIHMPTKSKQWTSPLALSGEQSYEPSVMSSLDPRNESGEIPYFKSIAKWSHIQPEIDEDLVQECAEDIGHWYAEVCAREGVTSKVLTKTEAINSGRDWAINPLNRTSSPGYPWRKYETKVGDFLCNKGTGNEAYYGLDLKKKSAQRLNNSIDNLIDISRTPGQYPKIAYCGALKDEPIKKSKIATANTRSFAGAPLDYTIASRMYFGPLQGAMAKVRFWMPVQIGMDPTSLEWDGMIKRLRTVSDKGFDLDFSNWDGLVHGSFVNACSVVYNAMAREIDPNWKLEDDVIRTNLNRVNVKPYLLVGSRDKARVVMAPGGMPSGSPRTANDNSIAHLISFYYCYRKIMREHGMHEWDCLPQFLKNIQAIIYGDDGGYAVHPNILDVINFQTMQKEFEKLGMKCTPAAKDGKIYNFCDVLELEFLKRSTVRIGAHYYGKLHEKSFQKMLGYCKGPAHDWWKEHRATPIKEDDLIATVESALREALFHGRKFYDEMAAHCKMKLKNCGIHFSVPRFKDLITLLGLPLPRDF